MRSILTLALGAILSVGASGAQISCDINHKLTTVSSAGSLAKLTNDCISSFCANGVSQTTTTEQCGPLVLTMAPLNGTTRPSDVADCVGKFQSILSQCVTTDIFFGDKLAGGVAENRQAVYDISVKNVKGKHEKHALEARRNSRRKTRTKQRPAPKTKTRGRTRKSKTQKKVTPNKNKKKPTPKKKTEQSNETTGLPKKKTKKTKQSKKHGKKKPKACPLPGAKKGKAAKAKQSGETKQITGSAASKVIREVQDSAAIPQVAKRMLRWFAGLPPKNSGGGNKKKKSRGRKNNSGDDCSTPYDKWYKETILYRSVNGRQKVIWWMFNSAPGWKRKVPENSKAFRTIEEMRRYGKLDVIRITPAKLYALGKPSGGTVYTDWTERPNSNYLLVNGGFFKMTNPNRHAAVGETSTTESVPLPDDYRNSYERIQGDDGSYLYSGPALLQRWKGRGPKWEYNDITKAIVGSLSHANQPNDRLALVMMANGDKYIFAYTGDKRSDGMNMSGLRNIIMTWFEVWNPRHVNAIQQITNLDGGGSINVVWQESGKRPRRLAQGNVGDEIPTPGSPDPRRTANFIAISPFEMSEDDLNGNYEEGEEGEAGPA